MSDTLSDKKRTVKNSSTNRNPRPTRPQPSFASAMRLATRGSDNCKHSQPKCADEGPAACDDVVGDIEVEAERIIDHVMAVEEKPAEPVKKKVTGGYTTKVVKTQHEQMMDQVIFWSTEYSVNNSALNDLKNILNQYK